MKPTKRKNADRFGIEPVLNARNKPMFPMMTDRQKAQLLFIARHRFCTVPIIHSLFRGDLARIYFNVQLFKAKNVFFVRVCDNDRDERNIHTPDHLEITDRGIAYLIEEGLLASDPGRPRVTLYKHALLAMEGLVSIEQGISQCPHATLIDWPQIKENLPAPLDNPFEIPCTVDGKDTTAHADSPPFGIRLELSDHTKTRYFPGIEAERGTKNKAEMIEQFKAYIDIENSHQYVDHFGFKKFSFYVPFLIRNFRHTNRLEYCKQLILDLGGSKSILLKEYQKDGPLGYVATTDWQRAGHAPFNLLK
jgi:hypothetical protein